jgi:hypothetical protein
MSSHILHFLRKAFAITALFFLPLLSWGIDLKKFDAPPPERDRYLTFKSPPSLRFTPVPLAVDRMLLISPSTPEPKASPKKEDNASAEPDFPIVTYSTEPESNVPAFIPQTPSNSLPMADPFEGVSGTKVGSTDELLNVFEDMKVDSRTVRVNAIPFIPPYTVAPDNLKIGTKSTYRRVPR